MAFRIHALSVGHIVTALRFVGGRVSSACARHAPAQQAYARADCGTTRVAADCRTRKSAYRGTNDSTAHRAVLLRLCSGLAADLIVGVLPASAVVGAELIEVPARTGQCHDARPRGHADTADQAQHSYKRQ